MCLASVTSRKGYELKSLSMKSLIDHALEVLLLLINPHLSIKVKRTKCHLNEKSIGY